MRKTLLSTAATFGAFCLAFSALAQTAAPQTAAPAPATEKVAGAIALGEVKATATVEDIDVAKRLLTLKGPSGKPEVYEVDAAVKNLDQVKKGDKLVVVYKDSIAWELKKPGTANPGVAATGGIVTAKPGEKPGAVAGRQITAVVTITGMDKKVPSVTFKGPAGNEKTIKIRDAKNLESAKVGDQVEIVYTEALAISIEKAPAEKAPAKK